MSTRDKLIEKILNGNKIKTSEAKKILEFLNYEYKTTSGGSHRTYRKKGRIPITIVLTKDETPYYTVEDLQNALKQEGY